MTDLLIEQANRHSVYTQRFAGHLANLFDPYAKQLRRDIKLILSGAPSDIKERDLNVLINRYKRVHAAMYNEYKKDVLLAELKEFTIDEGAWQVDSLKSVVSKAPITAPSNTQLWATVNASPFTFPDSAFTASFEEFLAGFGDAKIKKIEAMIRVGFGTGQTTQQIVSNIAGKNGFIDKQYRQSVKATVRTATNHVANVARQKINDDNKDIVIGYQLVATLDGRTSDFCSGIDGTIVYNSGKSVNGTTGTTSTSSYKPMPPFHINCRTTTVPVLGKEFDMFDQRATRASRGSEGGAQVDADLTRYEWLKQEGLKGKKGLAFVQDSLGIERANLLVNGGLTAKDFAKLTLDEVFRPIPLKELRKKKSLQFAFDKID